MKFLKRAFAVSKDRIEKAATYEELLKQFAQENPKRKFKSPSVSILAEMHFKYSLIVRGMVVLDIGSAPGGFAQFTDKQLGKAHGTLISVDLRKMLEIPYRPFINGDFFDRRIQSNIVQHLQGKKIDLILSDLSPPYSGIVDMDSYFLKSFNFNTMQFAMSHLKKGGTAVIRYLESVHSENQLSYLKNYFHESFTYSYPGQRIDSPVSYYIGKGFMFNQNFIKQRQFISTFYKEPKNRSSLLKKYPFFSKLAYELTLKQARQLQNRGYKSEQIMRSISQLGYCKLQNKEWQLDGVLPQQFQFYPRTISQKIDMLKRQDQLIEKYNQPKKKGLLQQNQVLSFVQNQSPIQKFMLNLNKKIYYESDLLNQPKSKVKLSKKEKQSMKKELPWFKEQLHEYQEELQEKQRMKLVSEIFPNKVGNMAPGMEDAAQQANQERLREIKLQKNRSYQKKGREKRKQRSKKGWQKDKFEAKVHDDQ